MTLTPAQGCISMAEERLRNMLAACATFQKWIGGGIDPLDRIHLHELVKPRLDDEEPDGNYSLAELQSMRPYALLFTSPQNSFRISIVASPGSPDPSGTLTLLFWDNVESHLENDYPEAYRRFMNNIGSIIHSYEDNNPGLVELLRRCEGNYLNWTDIAVESYFRTGTDDQPTIGDAHCCELTIRWGGAT